MKRVRMFCDWDNDSRALIERLQDQTDGFEGDQYGDVLFVDDDSYTHAVAFNYPTYDFLSPAENNIALLLEPPEISVQMHAPWRDHQFDNVRQIYSFVNDPPHKTVYGLGFATVPKANHVLNNTGSSHAGSPRHIMCMVVSNKILTPYHVKRHEIKDALLETNINVHFYGRGLKVSRKGDWRIKGDMPPMGKHRTLRNYSFCIDFENSKDAVTDKFFDPILCGTVPVSNSRILHQYADNSFVYINFEDSIEDIVEQIRQIPFKYAYNYDIRSARESILGGRLSLAKWIRNKVNEA